ncbi:MAG TPA: Gfo/Idh/MocA family oxidoreductase [Bryobacteraceae bacterium]|nr:Gfo/Idh/MocA family oxidoreductase [Bryobacteraceae bacterium]
MRKLALLVALPLAACAADLRLGIVGTDTSHVIEFTRILNDNSSPEHVPGARVVAAFKGGSQTLPDSYKRVDKFAEQLRTRWNVEFVSDIASLCAKVDGVMIESVDGRQHLDQVKQAVSCGKPIWIDKPLASSLEDAREIERVAKGRVPWFSASALRYGKDVEALKFADTTGAITWGAGPLGKDQLDLSYYAIHVVELLYSILGTGCEEVTRTHTGDTDIIVGKWRGGKTGEVRAVRPDIDYGAMIFRKGGKIAISPKIDDSYRPLVEEIVKFFETRQPPVPNEESLEVMEFMHAAQRSLAQGGMPVRIH